MEDSRSAYTSAVCSGYQWIDALLVDLLREHGATVKSRILNSTLKHARGLTGITVDHIPNFYPDIHLHPRRADPWFCVVSDGSGRFDFSLGLKVQLQSLLCSVSDSTPAEAKVTRLSTRLGISSSESPHYNLLLAGRESGTETTTFG